MANAQAASLTFNMVLNTIKNLGAAVLAALGITSFNLAKLDLGKIVYNLLGILLGVTIVIVILKKLPSLF